MVYGVNGVHGVIVTRHVPPDLSLELAAVIVQHQNMTELPVLIVARIQESVTHSHVQVSITEVVSFLLSSPYPPLSSMLPPFLPYTYEYNGASCPDSDEDTRECNTQPCPSEYYRGWIFPPTHPLFLRNHSLPYNNPASNTKGM